MRQAPPTYPERIAATFQRVEAGLQEGVEVVGIRSDDRLATEAAVYLGLRSRVWEQTVLFVDADPAHSETAKEVVRYSVPTIADLGPGAGREEVLKHVTHSPVLGVHVVSPAEDGEVDEHLDRYLDVLDVLAGEHRFVVIALPDLRTPAGKALVGRVDTLVLGPGHGAGSVGPADVEHLDRAGQIFYVPQPGREGLQWQELAPFPESVRRRWDTELTATKNYHELNHYLGTILYHSLHGAMLAPGGPVYDRDLPEGLGLEATLRRKYWIGLDQDLEPVMTLLRPRLGNQPEAAGELLAALIKDREGSGPWGTTVGPLEVLELAEKARLVLP